jgi:hypothetical protein
MGSGPGISSQKNEEAGMRDASRLPFTLSLYRPKAGRAYLMLQRRTGRWRLGWDLEECRAIAALDVLAAGRFGHHQNTAAFQIGTHDPNVLHGIHCQILKRSLAAAFTAPLSPNPIGPEMDPV